MKGVIGMSPLSRIALILFIQNVKQFIGTKDIDNLFEFSWDLLWGLQLHTSMSPYFYEL
jgi:hypothetical protein